jgi:lysozyme family protein
MSRFEVAINPLLDHEGGRFKPADNGRGASKWGVTLRTLQESKPQATAQDIQNLTRDDAVSFYRQEFWEHYHLGVIADQTLATKMLDLSVNVGGGTAVKLLQKAVLLPPDGLLGSQTAQAVNQLQAQSVLTRLRAEAGRYYRLIVGRHPEWGDDLGGWLQRLSE